MKIFVIGSMINSKEIEFSARALKTVDGNTVRYEEPIDEIENISCAINKAFDNIEWCDRVYVVRENNGELGDRTTCEIEYARRLRKEIYYLN